MHGWPRGVIGSGWVGRRTDVWVALRRRQARLLSAVLVAPSAFLAPSALRNRRSVAAELPRWLREIACRGTGGAASARHRSVRKRGGKTSPCVSIRTDGEARRSLTVHPCTRLSSSAHIPRQRAASTPTCAGAGKRLDRIRHSAAARPRCVPSTRFAVVRRRALLVAQAPAARACFTTW